MQARTALLAAYYVLDEDGALGLSEGQLVGLLTSEAGIGVGRVKAEQLWQILASEELANTIDTMNHHSSSAPPVHASDGKQPWVQQQSPDSRANTLTTLPPPASGLSSQPSTMQEAGEERPDIDNNNNNNGNDMAVIFETVTAHNSTVSDKAAVENAPEKRAARAGRAKPRAPSRGGGPAGGPRVDVHAFLRLTDLLHQSFVVDDDDDNIGQDGGGGGIGADGEGLGLRVGRGGQGGGIQRYGTSSRTGCGNGSGSGVWASGTASSGGDGDDRSQPASAMERGSHGGNGGRSRSGRGSWRRRCKRWFQGAVKRTRRTAYGVVRVRWFICCAQVGAEECG